MLVELRERVGRRDRLLFTFATVPTFIILMTTVSCSTPGPGMPQQSPKVATVNAPKAKKANTPPRVDAQEVQELFQEFLEWRKRKKDLP